MILNKFGKKLVFVAHGSSSKCGSIWNKELGFNLGGYVSSAYAESIFMFWHVLIISGKKKKRGGARAVGPDKGGRGLRQFSMKGAI